MSLVELRKCITKFMILIAHFKQLRSQNWFLLLLMDVNILLLIELAAKHIHHAKECEE